MATANDILRTLRAYAKTTPDAPAIVDDDGKVVYSFRDFVALADGITLKLRSLGVGPGSTVPIHIGRTVEHIATRLSVISMGAVALSLDPLIPEERVNYIIRAAGCKLTVDMDFFPVEPCYDCLDYPDFPENIPAFIIFTSGSTGTPKGVLHPRATLTYFYDLLEDSRTDWSGCSVASIVSVSFVPSYFEFIVALGHGRTIYNISDALRGDVLGLRKVINEHKMTHLISTASYYRALGHDTTLQDVFIVGERAGAIETKGHRIVNVYGSSEAIMAKRYLEDCDDAPIGEPMDGTLTIIDENGNPADEGELVYRGRGIMLGYLHKMVGGIPSKPMDVLYTGDLGRREADGIHIIGRKGDMIKINGQRVEPAEVEYVLSSLPGIDLAVVKAFFDSGTYLCAYYTSAEGIDPETVRYELTKKLNPYMVPSFIQRLDSFAKNNHGKIDRASLETLRPKAGNGVMPVNEIQAIICHVFEKILNIDTVSIDDYFMKIGGDSVKAIRAQSELSDLGIDVKIEDILNQGTPRHIAEVAESDENLFSEAPVTVTPIQNRLASGKSRHGAVMQAVICTKAPIDSRILQKAINAVTDRHTALRSSIRMTEKGCERSVSPRGTCVCKVGDNVDATSERPIVCYVEQRGGVDYIVVKVHRSIADQHSLEILTKDFTKTYVEELMHKTSAVSFGSDYDRWWKTVSEFESYGMAGEDNYWHNVERQLVPTAFSGPSKSLECLIRQAIPGTNVFAASSEEIVLASIVRAYSRVFATSSVSAEVTSSSRWLGVGRSADIVGNLDAMFPAIFNLKSTDESIEEDIFTLMDNLRNVPRAGLAYGMKFPMDKAADLSVEFFKLNSLDSNFVEFEDFSFSQMPETVNGINISVIKVGDNIRLCGNYADVPEVASRVDEFLLEVKTQMRSIVRRCEDNLSIGKISCPLTSLQLLRMLVIVGDKMPMDHTVSVVDLDVDAAKARSLVEKIVTYHPALCTRLIERNNGFWLEYAGTPEISIVPDQTLTKDLLHDFVIEKALCRFIIVDKGSKVTVLADLHHQISDISSLALIADELKDAVNGKFPSKVDLGIVYAYWDERTQMNLCSVKSVKDYVQKDLGSQLPVSPITDPKRSNGQSGDIRYILTESRSKIEKYAKDNGLTLGSTLTAAFGYVTSLFTDKRRASFFFLEHGRHVPESESSIGMYFRVLPMAVDRNNVPASTFIRDSMKNMVKAMSLRYASEDDYAYWLKGDYVQFKYQTDMNERSGVSRLLGFMPAASYLSFMVSDLGDSIEVQLKYPPTASEYMSELLVRAYDLAITGFINNRTIGEMDAEITRILNLR